jgi:hypothetical protein
MTNRGGKGMFATCDVRVCGHLTCLFCGSGHGPGDWWNEVLDCQLCRACCDFWKGRDIRDLILPAAAAEMSIGSTQRYGSTVGLRYGKALAWVQAAFEMELRYFGVSLAKVNDRVFAAAVKREREKVWRAAA